MNNPTKTGRPSLFTPELAAKICERIELGESLRAVCKLEGMPSTSTVFRWLDEHNEFRERYARAKERGLDLMAMEIIEIADTTEEGVKIVEKPFGDEVTTGDMIEHRKLRVDARKWYLSKLAPKKYGDKQEITHKVDDEVTARLLNGRSRTGG